MTLTIKLTQLKRKKRKDGTIPIYIRVTEDGRSRYKSTGIAVKKSEWNRNKKRVSLDNETEQIQTNILLDDKLDEVKKIKRELYKRDALSMDGIMNELSSDKDTRSILHQAEQYKKHLQSEDRYWGQRHFTVVINNLTAFIDKNHSERLDALDGDWIESFQHYLLTDVGNGNNTVHKKLQRLKGMTDWLLKKGDIKIDPFTRVDRVNRTKTNSKVKLSLAQIQAIESLHLSLHSDLWYTRNYFMFSFYNAGIRFGDLCCLTWGNLIDGRLVYSMNKTGGRKSINQQYPMYRILFQYVDRDIIFSDWEPTNGYYVRPKKNIGERLHSLVKHVVIAYSREHSGEYIFPILEREYSDSQELRKRISSKNVIVNRHLKTIADKAGIQANLSFHVSRHSFAHYALKKGMDLYAISKALGHSDLKVTEEYIKSFDEELLDKSMNQLF